MWASATEVSAGCTSLPHSGAWTRRGVLDGMRKPAFGVLPASAPILEHGHRPLLRAFPRCTTQTKGNHLRLEELLYVSCLRCPPCDEEADKRSSGETSTQFRMSSSIVGSSVVRTSSTTATNDGSGVVKVSSILYIAAMSSGLGLSSVS